MIDKRRHRFSAAKFADDAERFAALGCRDRSAAHGVEPCRPRAPGTDMQVADPQASRALLCPGIIASRRPSPSMLMPRINTSNATPGSSSTMAGRKNS